MDKVGFPRGLVRHTTHNALHDLPSHILRPRVVVYGCLLLALLIGWSWGVTHRAPLIADVLRDRNALYRVEGDTLENVYTLKLVNKQEAAHVYRISLIDSGPVSLAGGAVELRAEAGAVIAAPFTLQAPAGSVQGRRAVRMQVQSIDDPSIGVAVETAFFGPVQ
jgi:polyferredoxin